MATQAQRDLTYADLEAFEDDVQRELIDGELIVTAAPWQRHQAVELRLASELFTHAKEHGGAVYASRRAVYFDERNVVEPDVVYVGPENLARDEKPFVRGAPDVVVEVSSPSTRRIELVRKRELYARFGVPEYWYVDLESDEVYVDRLHEGSYSETTTYGRGDVLSSSLIPGFTIEVDYLLGPREEA